MSELDKDSIVLSTNPRQMGLGEFACKTSEVIRKRLRTSKDECDLCLMELAATLMDEVFKHDIEGWDGSSSVSIAYVIYQLRAACKTIEDLYPLASDFVNNVEESEKEEN